MAKAKALLAEAGYKDGFAVKMAAPNISPWTDIAQSVQQTMGQAGIKVSIEPMELKAVISQYRARGHQIAMLSWGPDYFDPHTNADSFAHNLDNSDAPKSKPIAWRNKWFIPDITKEMLAAAKELRRQETRRAIRGAAEEGDRTRARSSSCSRTTTRWRGADRDRVQSRHHRGPELLSHHPEVLTR